MIPIRMPDDQKKPHKHKAKPRRVDGLYFASEGEAKRWYQLKLLERYGQVRNLRRQVRYDLHTVGPDGVKVKVTWYTADAVYEERQDDGSWLERVEDYKGQRLPDYLLRAKWMKLEYGIVIFETGRPRPAKRTQKKRGV